MKKHLEPISFEYNNGYTKISECSFCKSRGLFKEFSILEPCRFCNHKVEICQEKAIWSHLTHKWYKQSESEMMNSDINEIINSKKIRFKIYLFLFLFFFIVLLLGILGA